MMFGQTKPPDVNDLRFATKADAFAYMLRYQISEKKMDPLEAAQKANDFANIFAENMGLPLQIEPPKKGIDKVISVVDKAVCYCDEHPRVLEYITGAATFAVGLFAGKAAQKTQIPEKEPEPIDFTQID